MRAAWLCSETLMGSDIVLSDALPANTPDIISRYRFDGRTDKNPYIALAIVIPAPISQPIYGELVCEVKVFSNLKGGYHFRGTFDIKRMTDREVRRKAGVLAGALAERICLITRENRNPVDDANGAMDAWGQALSRFEARQYTPTPRDATLDYIIKALEESERQR